MPLVPQEGAQPSGIFNHLAAKWATSNFAVYWRFARSLAHFSNQKIERRKSRAIAQTARLQFLFNLTKGSS